MIKPGGPGPKVILSSGGYCSAWIGIQKLAVRLHFTRLAKAYVICACAADIVVRKSHDRRVFFPDIRFIDGPANYSLDAVLPPRRCPSGEQAASYRYRSARLIASGLGALPKKAPVKLLHPRDWLRLYVLLVSAELRRKIIWM